MHSLWHAKPFVARRAEGLLVQASTTRCNRIPYVWSRQILRKIVVKYNASSLHHFTRGRFVCDEGYQAAQRYIEFNVDELAKAAARAAGAQRCASIEKFPDGWHNKALLLTMDDGREVVAKLPNPNAGRPHFTTASEVATMDFARSVLEMPVPKVLAWNSRSNENAVGAEYILMNKAHGVSPESVWPRMDIADRFAVVKTLASYQKLWCSTELSAYGSLYYDSDLGMGHNKVRCGLQKSPLADPFVVGPIEGREWNDEGRMAVDVDRGPCESLVPMAGNRNSSYDHALATSAFYYLKAIGNRERICIEKIPKLPGSPITLRGPGLYMPSRPSKLRAVDSYFAILQAVTPRDADLNRPCVWHSDLHLENIDVDPEERTKITCIIDWQSTEVAPLFVHARQPYLLDHDGDDTISLERPRLPANFAELSAIEKEHANQRYHNEALCALYRTMVSKTAPDIWKALQFRQTTAYELLLMARNLLIDGEVGYLAHIMELVDASASIAGADEGLRGLPIAFADEERAQITADVEAAVQGMQAMSGIRDALCDLFPERGVVRHEQYDEAKDALWQMKEQVLEQFAGDEEERAAWQQWWPFDD